MKNSSNKKTSSFSEAHDKALRIGLEPGSEDYRLAMDSQMRNPAERSRNQALEKVKDMATNAMSSISESGPAKGLRNYGRMYKQGLGMKPETPYEYKKGGKVSSASKRADGIAIRGKTRA